MTIGDKVIETVGTNEAIGFMSRSTARRGLHGAGQGCQRAIIGARAFRFMVDEVPNFAMYIMGVMARRIRGMRQVV